jgi:hypothetical protein
MEKTGYIAPPWSWASRDGEVYYPLHFLKALEWEVSVLGFNIDEIPGPYGQV